MLKNRSSLVHRLNAADRSYQGAKSRSFLCRAVAGALGAVLLFFLLDVVFHLDAHRRLGLIALFFAAVLALIGAALYIWRVRRNRIERVARLVETQEPRLGSKVINLLQLAEQTEDKDLPELTRQLAAQAVDDYERELGSVNFVSIARLPRLRSDFKKALLAAGLFAALLVAFPQVTSVEWVRFADPYGDHPPYSFTQLKIAEPSEKGVRVIYNKSALVRVEYAGHQPREVFLSFYDPKHPAKTNTVEMFNKGKLGFWQQIDGVKSDLVVYAHTRDMRSVSGKREISVILTPKLERAFVKVSPPPYTGIKPEETPFQFKEVRALEGSLVQFRLQSNRPLREGVIEWTASGQSQKIAMTPSGENEVQVSFPARETGRMRFAMMDVDGISSEDLFEGSLTVTHDLPPEISIVEPNKDSFVSMDFKITAQIEASDDYGLKTIRIHRALNGVYSAPLTISYNTIVRSTTERVAFNFKELGIDPGDVISIFAEAIDTAPNPNLTRSQTVNLTVISEDDYNDFVREQHDISDMEAKYSELLNRIQDQIDAQKKLGGQIDQLKEQMAKASAQEKGALEKEMKDLMAEQATVNNELNKTADEMENFVRKRPVYDIEAEYQNVLSQKAQDIRESTAGNSQAMQKVARQQPGLNALQDFKKASDEQLKKLDAAQQEARQQIEKTTEDLSQMQELMNDFNHFEQLFETQQTLAEQNRAYNSGARLPREDQIALRQLAGTEKEVEDQLRQLTKKLRDDAKNAKAKFPKAAKSGDDLADSIDHQRMPPLAADATDAMLQANGEKSSALSEHLRAEMEKLFGECCQSQKQEEQQNELDTYLRLKKGMKAGNTFHQMMQSRKFGWGQKQGTGQGATGEGTSGYVISSEPTTDVLGGETSLSSGNAQKPASGKIGTGQGLSNPSGPAVRLDKAGALTGMTPVNRKSDAVTSEAPLGSYDDIVNKYFKAITK